MGGVGEAEPLDEGGSSIETRNFELTLVLILIARRRDKLRDAIFAKRQQLLSNAILQDRCDTVKYAVEEGPHGARGGKMWLIRDFEQES